MNKQKFHTLSGFSALEIILVIVVIGLAGGLGYVFWQKSQDTNQATPQTSTNKDKNASIADTKNTKLPKGWKTYSDKKFNFSIAYNGEFTPKTSTSTLAPDNKASSDQTTGISFAKRGIQADDLAPLEISITDQTVAQAVEWREGVVARNSSTEDMASTMTVTSKKSITVDGYPATRIDTKDTPQASTTKDAYGDPAYSTYVYIQVGDKTYEISTTGFTKDLFDSSDAQTMFTSLKLPTKA